MSSQAVRLGDWCPDTDRARWAVWYRAVDDYLWPGEAEKRAAGDLRGGEVFEAWATCLAVSLGLFDAGTGSRYWKDGIEAVLPPGAGLKQSAQADTINCRWQDEWRKLVIDDGKGGYRPGKRQAKRGMKFCVLLLVLMYGLHDGSKPDVQGVHCLTAWKGAVESASLLLALGVLTKSETSPFRCGFDHWPAWNEVARLARGKIGPGVPDLSELKEHEPCESIEGFAKRLRVSMNDGAFRAVKSLAAGFESQARPKLAKWKKVEGLDRWFR